MEAATSKLVGWLSQAVAAVRGRAAYFLAGAISGESYSYQADEEFRAASLIKIPILWSYLEKVSTDDIRPEELVQLTEGARVPGTGVLKDRPIGSCTTWDEAARLMITQSDNTAANLLIELLGFDALNKTISNLGLCSTRLRRKMYDFGAASRGAENITTARDVARVMRRIALDRSIDPIARKTFDLLRAQGLNGKLPYHLPPQYFCAHKTGDLPRLEHDAGIVGDGAHQIVAVALSDDLEDNQDGVSFCREVGRAAAAWVTVHAV